MKIERQLQGTLNTVFTELVKEKGLEAQIHPYASIEENRADITLKDKNGKAIFFIELKDPTSKDGKSVFDGNVVMREAARAQKNNIQYFGNCNFLACAFFDVNKFYDKVSVHEGFFSLADITKLSQNYSVSKDIQSKLRKIAEFYIARAIEVIEKKPILFSDVDELFIFKIRKLIEVFAPSIAEKIWEKYKRDKVFEKEITKYAQSQLWNKPVTYEETENLTHISLLMLISKLIFYKTYVDNQVWHKLHPMTVGAEIKTAHQLEKLIWKYFEEFKEITGNFELLIGERSDIIFQMPFHCEAVIDLIKDILSTGEHYNFSKIPYDIIGRIFEELIREDERHKLGQYFTSPLIIDLINAFSIHKASDKVLDPSCGSGTFLVRAYERKKKLLEEHNKPVKHEDLLDEIYGNDLSGYPAYLSMLNLAIRNPDKASYPKIINKDFFAITSTTTEQLHNQEGKYEKKLLPKFDAIVGNPPYTRQEDIGTMNGTQSKEKIQKLIKTECHFEPSQRTSIYAYFFYHASAFLTDQGYLAFIVQNSWMDTDYGIDLQKYLLNNFEIIAIIDSEIERFFPSASVNTSIVILKKQKVEEIRNNNPARFVYLTRPLTQIIQHYKQVEGLRDVIMGTTNNIVTDHFHINCITQSELSAHTKWGLLLKAPKVYFDILEKGKNNWVSLSSIADVKFGLKTGCNEFFIVKDITEQINEDYLHAAVNNFEDILIPSKIKSKKLKLVENGWKEIWLIEQEFLKPMLTSPKDTRRYELAASELPYSILVINKEKKLLKETSPYAFRYIQHGEKQHLHQRPSLNSRPIWYNVGAKDIPALSFNYIINEYGRTFKVQAYSNNNFHNIYPKNGKANSIWLYLNSTIAYLIQQLIMRSNLGDGAGKIETYELCNFPVINLDFESTTSQIGVVKNLKEEFGDLQNLEAVSPERRALDEAILEAIGYEDKQERDKVLLELYQSTVKIIQARFSKAQSLKTVKSERNKISFSTYIDQLKLMLIDSKLNAKNTLKFAKELKKIIGDITSEAKLQNKIFTAYWKERFGEAYNEKKINDSMQGSMFD
jgi:type I restriction enzyme M protein